MVEIKTWDMYLLNTPNTVCKNADISNSRPFAELEPSKMGIQINRLEQAVFEVVSNLVLVGNKFSTAKSRFDASISRYKVERFSKEI